MAELVDLAWGRVVHLGLDFNKEPMVGNDVSSNANSQASSSP